MTGASRGIGRAIAVRLALEGMHVILTGRDTAALAKAAAEITGAGGAADCIALDLREASAPAVLVAFAIDTAGRIDVVVNNAGATRRGRFMDLADEDWIDGYAGKFFGAVRLTKAAWPHLMTTKGSVVNIAGVGGRTPGAEFSLGGSVNAAMMALTKSLAETGIADGVQVNAINPGAVRTDRLTKRIAAVMARDQVDAATAELRFVAHERVTRIGEPVDIAGMVWFMVSPAGRFLQGALIDLDGGATKSV